MHRKSEHKSVKNIVSYKMILVWILSSDIKMFVETRACVCVCLFFLPNRKSIVSEMILFVPPTHTFRRTLWSPNVYSSFLLMLLYNRIYRSIKYHEENSINSQVVGVKSYGFWANVPWKINVFLVDLPTSNRQ